MNERRRLEQLQGGGRRDRLVSVVSACSAPSPVAERRAQPFTGAKQVPGGLTEENKIRADIRQMCGLGGQESVQAGADAVMQIVDVERNALPHHGREPTHQGCSLR